MRKITTKDIETALNKKAPGRSYFMDVKIIAVDFDKKVASFECTRVTPNDDEWFAAPYLDYYTMDANFGGTEIHFFNYQKVW